MHNLPYTIKTLDAPKTWLLDSGKEGPTTAAFGGVHGDEQPSIELVRAISNGDAALPLHRGRLIVALGNLAAIGVGQRLIEHNLNRLFRDFSEEELSQDGLGDSDEYKRSLDLITLLNGRALSSETPPEVLALYDSHAFRQEDGNPFIITEPRGFALAHAIGAPIVSSGWTVIEPGGTDHFMEAREKLGICHESGQLNDPLGMKVAHMGLVRFLAFMGHVDEAEATKLLENPTQPKQTRFIHATRAVLAGQGFEWGTGFPFKSFQALDPNNIIATNNGEPIIAGASDVIIFPSGDDKPKKGDEMFNLGHAVDVDTSKLPTRFSI